MTLGSTQRRNRTEYQESSLDAKKRPMGSGDNLTTFMRRLSRHPGSLNLVDPLWVYPGLYRESFTFTFLYDLHVWNVFDEWVTFSGVCNRDFLGKTNPAQQSPLQTNS